MGDEYNEYDYDVDYDAGADNNEYELDDGGVASNNEDPSCKVYDGNDSFTAWVQIFLATFALGSLWFKRMREKPRRKFQTWFMDVSKQGIGAVYAHLLNMLVAAVIANNHRAEDEDRLDDECAWYAINYLVDTTFGLVLALVFLKGLDYIANQRNWESLKNSGVYFGPEKWTHWRDQVIAWVAVLTVVKLVLLYFMWIFSAFLAFWGRILFKPMQSNIRFELIFVMIVFPGFLNVIYFWVIDSYIKAHDNHAHAHEPENEDQQSKTEVLVDPAPEEISNTPMFPVPVDIDGQVRVAYHGTSASDGAASDGEGQRQTVV